MNGKWQQGLVVFILLAFFLTSCGPAQATSGARETARAVESIAPTATSTPAPTATVEPTVPPPVGTAMGPIIPMPVSVTGTGDTFNLVTTTEIYVSPETDEMKAIGQYLADRLKAATGFTLQVIGTAGVPGSGNIFLTTNGGSPFLGGEGYELSVSRYSVVLTAYQPSGIFHGIQTIRQILPPAIESPTVQPGPWTMPTGTIIDYPRFAWRGAMLDVARHFFSVEDVEKFIDLMAYYKLNILHLHLTDDQGWRIMINSFPDLTRIGGSTSVGGGSGGFYTQSDYSTIVAYAQSRYITVVPEIDVPGHVNAALASYPELNCSGKAPALYTGTDVGFSALCVGKYNALTFVTDVLKEVVSLTPGPYIHIGGDEATTLNTNDYAHFIELVQQVVASQNKTMVGWGEIGLARMLPTSIAQEWKPDQTTLAVSQSARIIMSPASKAYLDMKYTPSTSLGQDWAGDIEVSDAYNWDPATLAGGITDSNIVGIEAPLWSETLKSLSDVEYMAFPRLIGFAEIGWSPLTGRSWDEYKLRLAEQAPRLASMGVNFYKSPQVPWK